MGKLLTPQVGVYAITTIYYTTLLSQIVPEFCTATCSHAVQNFHIL
jgi:hypothetical protein